MLTGHCTEGQLELWLEGETQLLPRPPVPAAGTGSLSGLTGREDHALCVTATAPAFTHMRSGIINSKPHPSHGLSGQNTCGRAGTARGSLPGLLKPLMPSALRKTQMTRMSHKTTLQEHHTPALQISTCKSVTAHLGITNTGPQTGLDPFADLAQHALSCRHNRSPPKPQKPVSL